MKFCIGLLSGSWKKIFFFNVFIFNPIWPPDHVTDDVINLILHSHCVVDQIYEISGFLNKDFDSNNYGWNTTSPMMSLLSPDIPHGEFMTYAKFRFFLALSGFGEKDVQFFFL